MKKLLFISAIFFAVLMTSCFKGGDYKSYVPADSKLVAKVDFKEFIKQTNVDQEKLFKDIKERYGDEVGDMKNSGIDLTTPFYIFARKNGSEILFGAVAKVEERGKVEEFLSKKAKASLTQEKDYSFEVKGDNAIAVNEDVLVVLGSTSSDNEAMKTNLSKVMKKEIEGDVSDNNIFKNADGNGSFASLYADMSLFSEAMEKEMGKSAPAANLDALKKMEIGIDATCKDGVCDFKAAFKSNDKELQEKMDKSMKAFGKISEKATAAFSQDDMFGIALNESGEKIMEALNEAINNMPQDAAQYKEIIQMISGFVKKIKGNVTFSMKSMDQLVFMAEGQNMTDEVVQLFKQNGAPAPKLTGNIYSVQDEMYFGQAGSIFCFTNNKSIAENPTSSGGSAPAPLISLMKDRRQVYFANVKKMLDLAALQDGNKEDLQAFKEITDKINYVTISL